MKAILIVEDDDSFREMLLTVIETRGFTAFTAGNSAKDSQSRPATRSNPL